LQGKETFCIGNGDSAVLLVQPTTRIEWYRDNTLVGVNQPRWPVNFSGDYHAKLYNSDGCSKETEDKYIFVDKPRPGISYPIEYAVENLPLTLQARQFGTSAVWNPATSLDDPSSFSPVFKGLYDQLYTITIKTNTGCTTVDTQLVKTIKSVEIYVPSAFTPNNDGINDLLRPILIGVKQLHYFRVYNRWGQVLYETKTNYAGWDGTVRGSPQSSQVVVWIVEGVGVDGRLYTKKGSAVLIR